MKSVLSTLSRSMYEDEKSDCSYSAAHSMDTQWFAIDCDGYVAVLETGENGIIPEVAAVTDATPNLLDILVQEEKIPCQLDDVLVDAPNITVDVVQSFLEHFNKTDLGRPSFMNTTVQNGISRVNSRHYSVRMSPNGRDMILWITEDPSSDERTGIFYKVLFQCPLADEVIELLGSSENRKKLVIATPHSSDFLLVNAISIQDLQLLLQRCPVPAWSNVSIDLNRFGLFTYRADEIDVYGDRYLQKKRPVRPVEVRMMPSRLKDFLESAKFSDRSFLRADEIWPRRYYRCIGWSSEG